MGTLWNTYAFYVLYANIDKFNPLESVMIKNTKIKLNKKKKSNNSRIA